MKIDFDDKCEVNSNLNEENFFFWKNQILKYKRKMLILSLSNSPFNRLGLKQNQGIRDEVATAQTIEQFRSCVSRLKESFEPYHTGQLVWINTDDETRDYNLSLPPWICQPYIRMEPEKHIEYIAIKQREAAEKVKEEYYDDDGQPISKNVMKRLKKASRKPNTNGMRQRSGHSFQLCSGIKCANPTVRHYHAYSVRITNLIDWFFSVISGT